MAVSNYLAKTQYGCRYNYSKLKNEIYLVSEEHLKKVYIDNGEAYISGITLSPFLKIEGFNIEFKEETSLDERYKFQKTLKISVNGYSTFEDFNDKYYAVIKTEDGTYYMINVDFPSKVTHTYNLSKNVNRTDFTLSSVSNFPALKLNNFNPNETISCKNYLISGVDGLKMIESVKAEITSGNSIIATDVFKTIEYLGDSLSFQEAYDGDKFTTTLEFQIAFDAYKSSWQYNLLEFILNRYAAIIGIKNSTDNVYAGFNNGLQPNYTIDASTEKGQSDIVTLTLVETSDSGLRIGNFGITVNTTKHWRYIKKIKNKKAYECIEKGIARYLLQEECDYFGNPTGRYLVLSGYGSLFPELNIIGTFNFDSSTGTFVSPDCYDVNCIITTDLPNTIYFTGVECKTYSLRSTGDWNITSIPSNITVSPTSGNANTNYTISVCNTSSSSDYLEDYFEIDSCTNQLFINVKKGHCITEYRFFGNYYCVDGNKYQALQEAVSCDGGSTWTKTGEAMLGELVEMDSQWCIDNPPTYSWELTDLYECEG